MRFTKEQYQDQLLPANQVFSKAGPLSLGENFIQTFSNGPVTFKSSRFSDFFWRKQVFKYQYHIASSTSHNNPPFKKQKRINYPPTSRPKNITFTTTTRRPTSTRISFPHLHQLRNNGTMPRHRRKHQCGTTILEVSDVSRGLEEAVSLRTTSC